MGDPTFVKTYKNGGRPGIYCRVITPGMVSPDDPIRHERYAGERVTIAEMLAAVGKNLSHAERTRFLGAPIGSRWRPTFEN